MKTAPTFAGLLQGFFTQRLLQQKQASPHTIVSYRDTFRLLLQFAEKRLHKSPARLDLSDIDAPFVAAFLHELEEGRGISARSRNLRLTAIRSFLRYAAYEAPAHAEQIQRVLAIPSKRYDRKQVGFLSPEEIRAILRAPNPKTWSGRRDHLLLLFAIQTGLRLSELTTLKREALTLTNGAHVRCIGKGRKERFTPLTKQVVALLKAWLRELPQTPEQRVFPNAQGGELSGDGMRYALTKHVTAAAQQCASLRQRKITPHMLRHTMAMELLQAGVDRAVIALWMGHESVETTQIYLTANLALKEKALSKVTQTDGRKPPRYHANDKLLAFLADL
jgi:site-specific recombinase XerD